MKFFFTFVISCFAWMMCAQNPCDISANVNDSLGQYKSTKNYLVYERNFAGNQSYIYFSMAVTDGMPTLNVQFLQKSKDFIKANCFNKDSRIFLMLNDGKIVTLFHIDEQNCGTGVRTDDVNNRILSGYFMFTKEGLEQLKASPVSLMRIRYTTETVDFIVKDELKAEIDGGTYKPSNYFISTIPCIER